MSELKEFEAQASGQGTQKKISLEELRDVIDMQEEAYELLSDRLASATEEEKGSPSFAALLSSKFCLGCEIMALRAKLSNLKASRDHEGEAPAEALRLMQHYVVQIEKKLSEVESVE